MHPMTDRIRDWRISAAWAALIVVCILIALNLTLGGCAAS
jgi:hypothetical protein